MQFTQFGTTGLNVSRLCLGCMTYGEPSRGKHAWTLPEESSRPLIKQAIDAGINFFDTANSYSDGSSEEIVGRVLGEYLKRDQYVLATKVFFPLSNLKGGLSRASIMQSIDDSLKRLGTDYVDLLQIHRWDYDTPIEETLEALNDVVKAGKARFIGASSMHAAQFRQALDLQQQHGFASFVSMQDQYNLIQREEEKEMHPLCLERNIAVLPWSPLARGRLTRPWGESTARSVSDEVIPTLYGDTEEADAKIAERVAKIAEDHGVPRAQIALAWILSKPVVTAPIIGASRAGHLEDAIAALDVVLSIEEIAELEMAYQPHQATGFK
ncbi:aldo/keto reductase [Rouxiella badensis]|jgi:aryl-alcohol dehydrogenase-like predicted oxidoreductase|uniref:Oxidoreductase n=1 Tax=Rouxiella badensis TaxID=1646377 RepID=A0A1X0WJE3_9GAMM|nr:aldo/keto reductase [Rouxiella badensis]MCC3702152.1 aldo/keto reductase [Rouxiella badensis]MCC3717158.1 aldo/keto reductase [Rouxiella badensis]MCC3728254.1 aldo/keto reductase [Rouxiella badensis]MCC3732158.1 aldo/keto reductase [Rouxiella badensis]MCC3739998.1 aldo/keto reductase [Rouxiella badensis]